MARVADAAVEAGDLALRVGDGARVVVEAGGGEGSGARAEGGGVGPRAAVDALSQSVSRLTWRSIGVRCAQCIVCVCVNARGLLFQ